MRDSHDIELACQNKGRKKRKKTDLDHLETFWFSTFMMLFGATGSLVGHD